MLKGCLGIILIGGALLIFLMFRSCANMKKLESDEIPKIQLVTQKFITHFNSNEYDSVYSLFGKDCMKAVTKEMNIAQIDKIKKITGNLVLGKLINWNGKEINSDQFVNEVLEIKGEKGAFILMVTFHLEGEWKILRYNVQLK